MNTSTTEPIRPNYLSEIDRTKREVDQENFREELIASIPKDEEDRDKTVEALNATLKFDPNKTVQDMFDEHGKSIGRTTNLSNRSFFADPRNTEKYGKERLQKVVKIMRDFTSSKLDIETKKTLGIKDKLV